MPRLGVYIHYPWCRKLCPYCDFAVAVANDAPIPHEAYANAVLAELAYRAPQLADAQLQTIYFGGGTPALWPPAQLRRVIGAVREAIAGDVAEITIEANPTDCQPETLAAWLDAGITRVSVGVQSFTPAALVQLGRDHRFGDGVTAIDHVRAAGFGSFSCDVIVGTPAEPPADRLTSVVALGDLNVPHISVYELTIEDRTAFGAAVRRGELVPLPDDELATIFERVDAILQARGYEHYEVSSYALPGHRARHNASYWRGEDYLGLGCGAASFHTRSDGSGERWSNHRSARRYLASAPGYWEAERDTLTAADVVVDRIWLGLRTSDGVDAELVGWRPELETWLLSTALARRDGERIRPTLRGLMMADEVARRVLVPAS